LELCEGTIWRADNGLVPVTLRSGTRVPRKVKSVQTHTGGEMAGRDVDDFLIAFEAEMHEILPL